MRMPCADAERTVAQASTLACGRLAGQLFERFQMALALRPALLRPACAACAIGRASRRRIARCAATSCFCYSTSCVEQVIERQIVHVGESRSGNSPEFDRAVAVEDQLADAVGQLLSDRRRCAAAWPRPCSSPRCVQGAASAQIHRQRAIEDRQQAIERCVVPSCRHASPSDAVRSATSD